MTLSLDYLHSLLPFGIIFEWLFNDKKKHQMSLFLLKTPNFNTPNTQLLDIEHDKFEFESINLLTLLICLLFVDN